MNKITIYERVRPCVYWLILDAYFVDLGFIWSLDWSWRVALVSQRGWGFNYSAHIQLHNQPQRQAEAPSEEMLICTNSTWCECVCVVRYSVCSERCKCNKGFDELQQLHNASERGGRVTTTFNVINNWPSCRQDSLGEDEEESGMCVSNLSFCLNQEHFK